MKVADPTRRLCRITPSHRAIGAVAVIVPTSLWFLTRGHPEGIKHNDHDAQKGLHTAHTTVEKSKYPAGRVGGKLHGIDDVVTTRHEDVDSDLPHDALNHPVNREKVGQLIIYVLGKSRGLQQEELRGNPGC